jgi:hypothetical protein
VSPEADDAACSFASSSRSPGGVRGDRLSLQRRICNGYETVVVVLVAVCGGGQPSARPAPCVPDAVGTHPRSGLRGGTQESRYASECAARGDLPRHRRHQCCRQPSRRTVGLWYTPCRSGHRRALAARSPSAARTASS